MSVTNTTNKVREQGNGSKTVFSFSFKIFDESQLEVYSVVRATDVATLKTISTHYTVQISTTTEGGTVTWLTPPSSLEDSLILRVVPYSQDADIPTESNFPEEQIEDQLDLLVMMAIQLKEITDRCIQVGVAETGISAEDLDDAITDATAAAAAALASQVAAAASASAASTSASGASSSASAAAASAIAAAASAAAAPVETAWTDYKSSSTIAGWATPGGTIYYKKIGKIVFVQFALSGTSNATNVTFTLPFANTVSFLVPCVGFDNGAWLSNPSKVEFGVGSSVVVHKDFPENAWTNSGAKTVNGQFWYEVA